MVKRIVIKNTAILKRTFYLFFLSSFLISCSPTQPTLLTQVININYSPSTENWMDEVYACANDLSIILKVSPQENDIRFQFGEPNVLVGRAYQIAEEELIVATSSQSKLHLLSLDEVGDLFASGENVWVYAEEEEMQEVFEQFAMKSRSLSPFARIAPNPTVMLQKLEENPDAVGVIPKSLLHQNLKEIYSVGVFPVLAIVKTEPQGSMKQLLACLQ